MIVKSNFFLLIHSGFLSYRILAVRVHSKGFVPFVHEQQPTEIPIPITSSYWDTTWTGYPDMLLPYWRIHLEGKEIVKKEKYV